MTLRLSFLRSGHVICKQISGERMHCLGNVQGGERTGDIDGSIGIKLACSSPGMKYNIPDIPWNFPTSLPPSPLVYVVR